MKERRIIWTLLALLALAAAVTGIADDTAESYADEALKRALVTFAAARTLNGVISVVQSTEVGVGVTVAVGQILDPVNDLIERFSGVMLVAASSLGLQNVMLGARLRGEAPRDDDLAARAVQVLASVGLEGRAHDLPASLSGGMRQRVALARCLMEGRPVVLMDEPFSSLDAITRQRLQDLSARLLVGCTVLLVTHDPLEALRLCHRVHVLTGMPAR